MKSQEGYGMELHLFFKEIGVTVNLIVDNHQTQKLVKVKRLCDQVVTIFKIL